MSCPQGRGGADSQPWLRDPAQPSWRKSRSVGRCQSDSRQPRPKWSLRSVQQQRGAGPGDPDPRITAQICGSPCRGCQTLASSPLSGRGTECAASHCPVWQVNYSESSSLGPLHPCDQPVGPGDQEPGLCPGADDKGRGARLQSLGPTPVSLGGGEAPPHLPGTQSRALTHHLSRLCPNKLEPWIIPGSWQWEAGSLLAEFLGLLSAPSPSTPPTPGERGWRERGTLPFLSAALHAPAPQGRALHPHHGGHSQVSPLPPGEPLPGLWPF